MGQCSTLPEARAQSSSVARHDGSGSMQHDNSSRQRLKEDGRASLDFNKLTTASNENNKGQHMEQRKHNNGMLQVTVPQNGPPPGSTTHSGKFSQMQSETSQLPQSRDPEQSQVPPDSNTPEPMEVDQRENVIPGPPPPPPESAVRTRCYKLNLDSELVGLSGKQQHHQLCLGPFTEPPPRLTCSSSEDSSTTGNHVSVAIQTAQIFRGITISKDGTILSQNARATRSNRGNKTKRGEKSRQAAKIDKAKDLVEEAVTTGKDAESNEPANMVSLVIVGEYDDMKQLVRDGSKKLREADGLPDDALLAINRPRVPPTINSPVASTAGNSSVATGHISQSKQRGPPSYISSSQRSGMSTPEKSSSRTGLPQSAPPKLKSHPRDRPKTRRHSEDKPRRGFVTDSCNDILENNHQSNAGEGDWRDALGFSKGFHSIWNCGGAEEGGTVSPTQVCSPKESNNKAHAVEVSSAPEQPVFEGRETNAGHFREGEVTGRAK